MRARDPNGYNDAFEYLRKNFETSHRKSRRAELCDRLKGAAPKLAEELANSIADPAWDVRSAHFREAWNWARVRAWIERLSDPAEDQRLRLALDETRERIRGSLQEIAAAKAWAHCFERMTSHERQHLVAWSKATRRIGKGKGKYADLHRRAAREHMQECRGAIPAWVMPLYRVVETIQPGQDSFDVVIIDEASQSGPEALLLTYLARQIIVVGDDKQISPEFVGINREDVNHLRLRYLHGLPHNDRYGADDSFFDLADIMYPGRIRLREHFRCMPEIIQFSNDLCYQSPPLIPLKQYSGGRLSPTVATRYIKNGYVQGSAGKSYNEPEAEALAGELIRCCQDPAYEGKTFGVISLLGEVQARRIEKLLTDRLGPEEMDRRQIVCGDAYAFQGDERDVIFLSLVSAPPPEGSKIKALTKESDQRRFNVAASRAREQMILFHSATLSDLNVNCLRHRLLEYCLNPKVAQTAVAGKTIQEWRRLVERADRDRTPPPLPFESWFEIEVFLRVAERGYRVIPQYEVAGYRIDLVVEGMEGRLAVECDGDQWHGPERYMADMSRQRMLERCGWRFWRVRGSAFAVDPDGALESLWEKLKELKIYPKGYRGSGADAATDHAERQPQETLPERDEAQTGVPSRGEKGPPEVSPESPAIDTCGVIEIGDTIAFVFMDNPNKEYHIKIIDGDTDKKKRLYGKESGWAKVLLGKKSDQIIRLNTSRGVRSIRIIRIHKQISRHSTPDSKVIGFPIRSVQRNMGFDEAKLFSTEEQSAVTSRASETSPMEGNGAQPYQEWQRHPLPDPRTANSSDVLRGLIEIIEVEGPVLALRVFQLYTRACGVQRLGRILLSDLNNVLATGLRTRVILGERDHEDGGQIYLILRLPTQPPVLLRTLGPRCFSEIPPSEIQVLMERLIPALIDQDP
jgi:very-short-patch-repair endonuclease/transcription elongation GreA/GreB family factor